MSLSAATTLDVTVRFATANDTAAAGIDYLATNGIITFSPGQTNKTILVPVISDLLHEPPETFQVNLSNPTNATLPNPHALVTIFDNDPLPGLSINDVTVSEGNSGTTNAVFTVSLSKASSQHSDGQLCHRRRDGHFSE